jgi:hypothetical protein
LPIEASDAAQRSFKVSRVFCFPWPARRHLRDRSYIPMWSLGRGEGLVRSLM